MSVFDSHVARVGAIVSLVGGLITAAAFFGVDKFSDFFSDSAESSTAAAPMKVGHSFRAEILGRFSDADGWGIGDWQRSLTVAPSDKVAIRVEFQNTGAVVERDVRLKATLYTGMNLVEGSTWFKAPDDQDPTAFTADPMDDDGVDIGDYAFQVNSFTYFAIDVGTKTCGQIAIRTVLVAGDSYVQAELPLNIKGKSCG
ncbi:hypothetical protein [Tsukamurella sp. NPDC003166]|uniref:hypothetical protein n=1 Tax=Tsukamurella sp. NPDC003166 TaxID=3154444 RepID=UPI0033A84D16